MNIAIVVNNGIQAHGDIRVLFPNSSFPSSGPEQQWMDDNNIKAVTYWKSYNPLTEKLVPCDLYLEDGEVYAVAVEDQTAEEIADHLASQVAKNRAQRDRLLQESDWVVTKALELGQAVPQEWIDYRQDLRDVPEQADQYNIVWPVKPE